MLSEDIILDLEELSQVRANLKRKENIKFIDARIALLKQDLQTKQKKETPAKVSAPTKTSKPSNIPGNAITVTKYSYDQEGKKVKIYLTFQNASTQLKLDQIDAKFNQNSFDLLIKDYKKQNYIFSIKKLFGPIDPESSKVTLKTNNVLITLTKKDGKHWDGLVWKENKFKDDKPGDKTDPEAGIMNLMKKMYEEGDDNMKRTIAESWTKSREGKK